MPATEKAQKKSETAQKKSILILSMSLLQSALFFGGFTSCVQV